MKRLALGVLSSLLVMALSGVPGPSAASAQAAAEAPTSLTVGQPAPTSAKGQLALNAKLATADGKPVSSQSIDFYVHVDLFGPREAYIGSATTDATGLATLGYQPAQAGHQTITARFLGTAGLARSQASADIQVGEAVPPFHAEPLPFAGLRELLPIGLAALVFVVWVVLLSVFLGTVRGIHRAAQS